MRYLLIIYTLFISNISANLVRPSELDTLHSIYGLFEWEQEPSTKEYNLQISLNESFNSIILDTTISKLMYLENNKLDWDNIYYWRVAPISENQNSFHWIDTLSFHTGSYKNNPNSILVEIINQDLIQDGLTIYGDDKRDCSVMYDKFGKEIWNDGPFLNTRLLHIDKFGQMYSSGLYPEPLHRRIPLKFNFNHDILWQGLDPSLPPYGMNAHDLKELPNGNFLYGRDYDFWGPIPIGPWTSSFQALGYEADGEAIEHKWRSTKIYEIDQNNYNILKVWDTTDYFSMNIYDSIGGSWGLALNYDYFDWLHTNSISYDGIEDALYLSSRHLSRITKIDYSTGDIVWMMGLPNEYISSNFDNHICTELLFSFQHDAKILDNGHLLFFDNGNLSEIVRETNYRTSRVLEIDILDDNTCNVIWEYDLPQELHGGSRGSVMKLNNGNYLINIATEGGDIIEVTKEKEIVWRLYLNNSGEYTVGNYRAFRVPSVYPDAYYTIFDSLRYINIFSEKYLGIILDQDDTFSMQIFNESGYTQDYHYTLNDSKNWFNNIEQTVTIDAQSSISITIQADISSNLNDDNLFNEIDFTVYPIYHKYAQKEFNFKVFEDSENIKLFNLFNIYPNPFNSYINIIYDIPYSSKVNISIYNLNGQLIEELSDQVFEKGRHKSIWNSNNHSSGNYFIQLVTRDFVKTKKITLLK